MPSKEVFIPLNTRIQKGVNVATILGNKETKGHVGIEIEVEGKKLPTLDTPAPWKYTEDHSLRAPKDGMCAEYVLRQPITFNKVGESLDTLWETFHQHKSKIMDSNRTSVHVHLNCQSWFLNRLTSFCALYFIVEEVLTEWCGDHRVGNLFCLRAKDAEAIVSYIRDFIVCDGQAPIQEFLHYAALNANALKKFGSLEIRTMRGCSDPAVIKDWIEILERLYNLSAEYEDPRDICASLSSVGPLAFFNNILGPKVSVIRNGIDMSDNDIANAVYEGVRIAQDLCYCRDWELYQPMELKPDVFGRSSSKIAKKLANFEPGLISGTASMGTAIYGQVLVSSMPQPVEAQELPYEQPVDDSWMFTLDDDEE